MSARWYCASLSLRIVSVIHSMRGGGALSHAAACALGTGMHTAYAQEGKRDRGERGWTKVLSFALLARTTRSNVPFNRAVFFSNESFQRFIPSIMALDISQVEHRGVSWVSVIKNYTTCPYIAFRLILTMARHIFCNSTYQTTQTIHTIYVILKKTVILVSNNRISCY